MQEMFNECHNLTTVPLFDTSNVTNMKDMFYECNNLTNVPLFNTSNVTNMQRMFYECNDLTTVPLFNTSKVTNMDSMFYNCTLVQSGALALYQQASSQANPPSSHSATFYNCGSNTTTGAAELEQIHWSWK
jgi:surface protein